MTMMNNNAPATIESPSQTAMQFIEAYLHAIQHKRLHTLQNATLEHLFKGRNLYLLRSTGLPAYKLMTQCLDRYLESADETLFANFSSELEAFAAQNGQPLEPSDIMECFAREKLPLCIELKETYDQSHNRLTKQFYLQFCHEDARIDWRRLARFASEQD